MGLNGVEWNGVEWNGIEWNGMERDAMEWSGWLGCSCVGGLVDELVISASDGYESTYW